MKNLGLALGTLAITVTGIYALYHLSRSDQISTELAFEDMASLKAEDSPCIQKHFSGLELKNVDGNTTDKIFEQKQDVENKPNGLGCLVVNWVKESTSSAKGIFRINWSLQKGEEGLVVFTKIDVDQNNTNKTLVSGVAYKLGKNEGKWEVKAKKDIDKDKDITSTNSEEVFPAVGEAIEDKANHLNKEQYWGFKSSVQGQTHTTFQKAWTWQETSEGETKSFDKWSSNFAKWWDKLFAKAWSAEETLVKLNGVWTAQ